MSEKDRKLRNERRRHQKLRAAVRKFLSDFKTGNPDDWQESMGVLHMMTARRMTDSGDVP